MSTINNCSTLWNAEYLFYIFMFFLGFGISSKGQAVSEEGLFWGPHLETIMNLIKMQFIAGWLAA